VCSKFGQGSKDEVEARDLRVELEKKEIEYYEEKGVVPLSLCVVWRCCTGRVGNVSRACEFNCMPGIPTLMCAAESTSLFLPSCLRTS
jgi:hypothetical protein